jgi:hypothetical protein
LEALRGQVAEAATEGARLSGALVQARQEAATATQRADAAERQAQRTVEALEASQVALTAAETASAALRLEVATLTERVAQSADLRAVIATLQASERTPATTEADAPALVLESTPEPATKKPAARRRGQTSQGAE